MFQLTKFVASAADLRQLPPDRGCEVAFAGRSNAGKSSAINAICARRKLAFVSRTPGRTQLINFFALGEARHLVDLPGYGYAKVPVEVRSKWETLIGRYLQGRRALRGLVIVTDARHGITPLDRQMLEWFSSTHKPVLMLLTKADKLSRQAASKQLSQVGAQLRGSYPQATVQLFSSLNGQGVEEARARIEGLLAEAGAEDSEATK
jgi:GTP-binding protein